MRILLAPDKFKGSLSSGEAAEAIAWGLARGWPGVDIFTCPLADGGEGTMEALVKAGDGRTVTCDVTGPLGEPRQASLGILGNGKTAVVEMAAASGLELIPPGKRDPLVTSTMGTGDLIHCALNLGARHIIVGIGGSGTNDGGTGMASALGARFLDAYGRELPPGGVYLEKLESIDISGLDPRVGETKIVAACDAGNPLLGDEGASRVYAPQKGAGPDNVERLERCLRRLSDVIRGQLTAGLEDMPGAGAAGGLGYGLMAFLGAEVRPGIEVVMEAVGFEDKLDGCDLVITGEGKLDAQTIYGKTVSGVAKAAKRRGIPALALGGEIAESAGALHELGITALLSVASGPMSLEKSMRSVATLLERTAREIGALLKSMAESVNR